MRISQDSPENAPAPEREAFTLESIRPVRDFTARKTLEQAHAFVEGVTRMCRDAEADEGTAQLVRELAGVGITAADADVLAAEAVALIEAMADRDRKADIFQAAVREAGQAERAMYERLAALARVLRLRLGPAAPELATFGVPPEVAGRCPRPRPAAAEAFLLRRHAQVTRHRANASAGMPRRSKGSRRSGGSAAAISTRAPVKGCSNASSAACSARRQRPKRSRKSRLMSPLP